MKAKYLMCPSYHGATVVSLMLNNHPDVTCLGDTLPPRSYDASCSCGNPVSSCAFWKEVENRMETDRFAQSERLLPYWPILLGSERINFLVNRSLEKLLLTGYFNLPITMLFRNHFKKTALISQTFYRLAMSYFDTKEFIDVKKPFLTIFAGNTLSRECPAKVLHITRDPRGYLYSFRKHKGNISPSIICRDWLRYHGSVERLKRPPFSYPVLTLRYEDLCRDPQDGVKQILSFFELSDENLMIKPGRNTHLIGNSKAINRFDGNLYIDTSWQMVLPQDLQDEVLEMTNPLAALYRYN